MIVTTAWMSQQFNRFNSTFFKGELPIPLFQLSRSRRVLGQFKCNKKLTLKGIKGYNFAIAMTTFYDFSEKQAQEVLLHEMIHYVIAFNGWWEKRPHGTIFMRFLHYFNEQHGFNLSVSERTNHLVPTQKAWQQKQKKQGLFLVLALKKTNNDCFLSVVNPRFAHSLQSSLHTIKGIQWHNWYATTDLFFTSFPSVRSLRGRKVSADVFQNKIETMTKVNTILPHSPYFNA